MLHYFGELLPKVIIKYKKKNSKLVLHSVHSVENYKPLQITKQQTLI